MNTSRDEPYSPACHFIAFPTAGFIAQFIRYLVGALALIFAGNAYAVITVDLEIKNDTDSNGNISVIKGTNVVVTFSVVEDTDGDLHKNDKIELLRESDDSVVATARRGKKKNGKVKLKVRNSAGEQLYVHYRRKGNAGAVIQTASHPDDGGDPLWSIARLTLDDITIAVNAMGIGAVSIPNQALNDEENSVGSYALCQLSKSNPNSFYRLVAGATAAGCDAWASIQLPHGRTITGLHCTAYDSSDSNSILFILRRTELATQSSVSIMETPGTTDSFLVQQVSDTTIDASLARVDNTAYAYAILANFSTDDFSTLGNKGRINSCSVTYR